MNVTGKLILIASIFSFAWWADWSDAAHLGVMISVGLVLAVWSRRRSYNAGASRPAIPVKTKIIQQAILIGLTFVGYVTCVWTLATPLSYAVADKDLEEARSRVRHLYQEAAWPTLLDAARRYTSMWDEPSVRREFARYEYDAHVSIALTVDGEEAVDHWRKALAIAKESDWDARLADVGLRLSQVNVLLTQASAEVRQKSQDVLVLKEEVGRLQNTTHELSGMREKSTSLRSDLAIVREEAKTARLACEKLQQTNATMGKDLEVRERRVAQLEALLAELRLQLSEARSAAKSVKRNALPRGTKGEILGVDFSNVLPWISISLRRPDGEPVLGLGPKDFAVTVDSHEKDIVAAVNYAERRDAAIMLAFDLSGSVEGAPLTLGTTAAKEFLRHLSGRARFSLITFASKPQRHVGWTADTQHLEAVIDQMRPGGETAIYDALWLALDEFDRSGATTQKDNRFIILFTDGQDTASRRKYKATVARAKQSGIPIFCVGLDGKALDGASLTTISQATGGRFVHANSPDELINIYRGLAGEIQSRYRIVVGLNQSNGLLRVSAGGENNVVMEYRMQSTPETDRELARSVHR